MDTIMTEFERTAKRNMLKWHVGQTIFCPGCQNVLDCKRAVEVDISKDGELKASKIFCAQCWDERLRDKIPGLLAEHGHTVALQDGRELFKRRR